MSVVEVESSGAPGTYCYTENMTNAEVAQEVTEDSEVTNAEQDALIAEYIRAISEPGWVSTAKVPRLPQGTAFLDFSALGRLPKPEWLVPGMLETDSFAVLYGAPGSHKSFYAIHLALSLAKEGKSVVYIAAEGFGGMRIRAEAWAEAFNDGVIPFGVTGFRVADTLSDGGPLMVDAWHFIHENEPALVVIDTLARTITGDENSTKDAAVFINLCTKLREAAPGCTLLAIHHSGKDETKGMRGASAIKAATDTVLFQTSDSVTVERSKNFEGESSYRYVKRSVGESLVLDFITDEAEAAEKSAQEDADKAAHTYTICQYLHTNPGAPSTALCGLIPGRRQMKLDLLHSLIEDGTIRTEQGKGRTLHHFLADAQSVAGMVEA